MNVIIVTRHAGAVEWLKGQGVVGAVLPHVSDPAQIAGQVVVGALPLHLAAAAAAVGAIDMPGLTPEQRGKDLSPAAMDAAGASIAWYTIRPASDPQEAAALAEALERGELDRSLYLLEQSVQP